MGTYSFLKDKQQSMSSDLSPEVNPFTFFPVLAIKIGRFIVIKLFPYVTKWENLTSKIWEDWLLDFASADISADILCQTNKIAQPVCLHGQFSKLPTEKAMEKKLFSHDSLTAIFLNIAYEHITNIVQNKSTCSIWNRQNSVFRICITLINFIESVL